MQGLGSHFVVLLISQIGWSRRNSFAVSRVWNLQFQREYVGILYSFDRRDFVDGSYHIEIQRIRELARKLHQIVYVCRSSIGYALDGSLLETGLVGAKAYKKFDERLRSVSTLPVG